MNPAANILKSHFTNRVILGFWLVTVTGIAAFSIYSNQVVKSSTMRALSQELATEADQLGRLLSPNQVRAKNKSEIQTLVRRVAAGMKNRLTVIAPDGDVLGDSDETWSGLLAMVNHRTRPEIVSALSSGYGQSIRYSTTLKTDMLYVAKPLWDSTGTIGVVRVALPLTEVVRAVANNRRTIFAAGAVGLVITFLMGIAAARILTRPIRAISRSVDALAEGKPGIRVPVSGKDELSRLAATINRLNGQLTVTIKELEIEKARLATIIEGMTEAVIALDEKNDVQFFNPAARRILEIPDAATGRNLLEASRINELSDLVDETRRSQETLQREIDIVALEPRSFQATCALLNDRGILLVLADITRLKQLERMREEFVANVSHELRTPLTLIQGNIEVLKGEKNHKTIERSLATIERHSERLNRLLADLLDLSAMDQDKKPFSFKSVDLKALIEKTVANFQKRAREKKQTLKKFFDAQLSLVTADPDRLEQVFTNLLDNAVKFTPEGGRIMVRTVEEPDKVRVEVIDNGPGIPEDDQPRIFERFYRVDKARSRELGGTGLGLAIVKHIIEAHQGTVSVESILNNGSKFCFTLPKA